MPPSRTTKPAAAVSRPLPPSTTATKPAAAPRPATSAATNELSMMRNKVASITQRYNAIEALVEQLATAGVQQPAPSHSSYDEMPAAAVNEQLDDAVIEFFAAARLEPNAVELPAFSRMLQALQRHGGHGYRPPTAEQMRQRLPTAWAPSHHSDHFASEDATIAYADFGGALDPPYDV